MMPEPLLELRKICKTFPGVQALVDVDFNVFPGEMHVLLGENGAGKSTLISIISGAFTPDSGEIYWKGQSIRFGNPGDAQRAGIGVIYQEPSLIPSLNIAENIHLGSEPSRSKLLPLIDKEQLVEHTLELFDRLNVALDPLAPVESLTLAERQMVAVAHALHASADLMIMDEPASMLSHAEVSQLFGLIRRLRAQGIGLVYVTHRLEEALSVGDRLTVLRDGHKIATLPASEANQADLVSLIAGRMVEPQPPRPVVSNGQEILRLDRISSLSGIREISLSLHAGEIFGLTGLIGAGGTSVLRAIFAVDPLTGGQIYLTGQPVKIHSPQEAVAMGIGFLTEDRQGQGLVPDMNAQENMTLAALEKIGAGPLVDHLMEDNIAHHYARRLDIQLESLSRKALFLSGGTQQKLILSRWLASQCQVLLLDEPTRGIDVAARLEFYHLIGELARRGIAILVVSSNLPEIIRLCDRIAVLKNGQIAAILRSVETSPVEILSIASGGTPV